MVQYKLGKHNLGYKNYKTRVNLRLTRSEYYPTSKLGCSGCFHVQKVNLNLNCYIFMSGWVDPFLISGRKSQTKLRIFRLGSDRVIRLGQLLSSLKLWLQMRRYVDEVLECKFGQFLFIKWTSSNKTLCVCVFFFFLSKRGELKYFHEFINIRK